MRINDRLVLFTCALGSLGLAGAAYLHTGTGTGSAAWARTGISDAVRVGTCDIFRVTDALLKVEPYDGLLKKEQEKANSTLAPMDKELQAMQGALQSLGPAVNDPANREKVQEFQRKRDEYFRKRSETQTAFDSEVSKINYEALLAARQQARATAEKLGYTFVIASRELDASKPPDNPAGFSITALTAPVVIAPSADDLTDRVIADLGVRDTKKAATTTPAEAAPPAKP